MCEIALLDVVARIALNNDYMILAGDDAQLPPIHDFYHNQRPPSFMDSDLLQGIAPVRIELSVCKRSHVALRNFGLLCRSATFPNAWTRRGACFNAKASLV